MAFSFRVFIAKFKQLLWHRQTSAELEDEIELHVQMLKQRFVDRGMESQAAELAARRQFGNATLLREHHHEQRTFHFLSTQSRDLQFGFRQFRQRWRVVAGLGL